MAANYDRAEFRKYLQDSGAVEAISRVFLKLYELKGNRPKSSVKFIQDRITDAVPSLTEYEKLIEDLKAMGTILLELKATGKLDSAQSDAIDKIGTIANIPDTCSVTSKAQPRISARHSQVGFGNKWKDNSNAIASSIRLLDKSNTVTYQAAIETAIANLKTNKKSNSLLKDHIEDLFTKYKAVTANNTSFVDCICSGLDIPESTIGVYATDVAAYGTYNELFNPIIKAYHIGFNMSSDHPGLDWGNPKTLADIEQTDQYIVWTRIRCIRNVTSYPLVPKMTEDNLKNLRDQVKKAFGDLSSSADLKGDLYELDDRNLDADTRQNLIDNKFFLEFGDKFLESVGATTYWPTGRAVYINKKRTFFVWINEEDHLRFISMETGSKIGNVYGRLVQALEAVAKGKHALKFQHNNKLGFVSLCPSNLGNTIRASVMMKLPKLTGSKKSELDTLIKNHNFEIRSASSSNDTIEISNKTKLGITEYASVEKFCVVINEIIEAEKKN